jgi:pantothenate kinase-related protein Tda10
LGLDVRLDARNLPLISTSSSRPIYLSFELIHNEYDDLMLRASRSFSGMSSMTMSPPKHPLIAIIGATGTGKSQVNLDLQLQLQRRY